jgi:hypothetical protein
VRRIPNRSVRNLWFKFNWTCRKPRIIRKGWFDEMLEAFESRDSKFRTTGFEGASAGGFLERIAEDSEEAVQVNEVKKGVDQSKDP